ncbi:MAG: ABC transporter ATP-binding protein, partial [Miltoncostaeaceae bacterium]
MAGAAVRARGLVKAYGPRVAVDGLDLDIRRGECFGFLGPNGAGKTTTMRMLACLSHRDAGELEVLGTDPDRDPRTLKARLGVVPQEVNLDLELSVIENMVVYGRYFGMRAADARSRAAGLLDFVGLGDRAGDTVVRLSGGMQRRLQIARALINDPAMILLDEPTTGLDPQARRLVWDRLRDLRATGTSVVLTTHYMDEAERLCDRLVIIDHGRVIREGSPAALVRAEVGEEVLEMRTGPGDAA